MQEVRSSQPSTPWRFSDIVHLVFAFFEHLITNSSKSVRPTLVSHDLQSQQYKQDVSTVACDVLRQFIEAHAGHVQVHPALAELEKLVN